MTEYADRVRAIHKARVIGENLVKAFDRITIVQSGADLIIASPSGAWCWFRAETDRDGDTFIMQPAKYEKADGLMLNNAGLLTDAEYRVYHISLSEIQKEKREAAERRELERLKAKYEGE